MSGYGAYEDQSFLPEPRPAVKRFVSVASVEDRILYIDPSSRTREPDQEGSLLKAATYIVSADDWREQTIYVPEGCEYTRRQDATILARMRGLPADRFTPQVVTG